MNERIKELAEQAGLVGANGHFEYDFFDPEKFAELIVQDCVKVMYDNAIERRVSPNIDKTPAHYAVAVLEHFGVNR